MTHADIIYARLADKIIKNGVKETNARTGVQTLRLNNQFISLTPDIFGLPILESKKMFWKTAIDELCWIFIKCSDNINDMAHPQIWQLWADKDGSIGKSYGYQAGKHVAYKDKDQIITTKSQLAYVIDLLSHDTSSRQAVIDLWSPTELAAMNLPPCVMTYDFTISDNRLNLLVLQRSADLAVGVPFDILEAGLLQQMVLYEIRRRNPDLVGLRTGELSFAYGDIHIYEMHIDEIQKQLDFIEQSPEQGQRPVLKFADKSVFKMTPADFTILNYTEGPKRDFLLVK